MEKLSHDFPAVPEVLGSLVPHQVNLWIGAAPEGTKQLSDAPLPRLSPRVSQKLVQ